MANKSNLEYQTDAFWGESEVDLGWEIRQILTVNKIDVSTKQWRYDKNEKAE